MRRAAAILNGRSSDDWSVGIGIVLHRGRYREAEQVRRVLPGELADVVGREAVELRPEELLGVGPGAVLVGVVGLEADVVDAYAVALLQPRAVLDGAEPEVALQHLGR